MKINSLIKQSKICFFFGLALFSQLCADADTIIVPNKYFFSNRFLEILDEYPISDSTIFIDNFKKSLKVTNYNDTLKLTISWTNGYISHCRIFNTKYYECTTFQDSIIHGISYIDKLTHKDDSIEITYHKNGNVNIIETWDQGVQAGKYQSWDSSGNKRFEGIICKNKIYDGVCNCMYIDNCKSLGISINYGDQWYPTGEIEYKLIKNDQDGDFVYIHYSTNGEIIDQTKLHVGFVKYCLPKDSSGGQFDVSFLVPY